MENPHNHLTEIVTKNIEKLKAVMSAYKDQAYLLSPFSKSTLDYVPPGYELCIRPRMISPVDDDGEVYTLEGEKDNPDPKDKVGLTKQGLQALAQLAGVDWPVCERTDDGKTRNVCSYKVRASVVDADGSTRTEPATYDLDLTDEGERAKKIMSGKYPKPKQLAQQRANITQLCETGAKSRAIRAILGIASSYRRGDLSKPFIVLKLNYIIDTTNPMVQAMLVAKHLGATKELFGIIQASQASFMPVHEAAAIAESEPAKALPPAPESHGETVVLPPAEEPKPAFDKDATIQRIQQLYLKKKGTTRTQLSPGKPSLAELNEDQLTTLENALKQLPDFPF